MEKCRRVAAVAGRRLHHVDIQVDIRARILYVSLTYGCGVVVKDLGEWRRWFTQNFDARLVGIAAWPGNRF